MLFKAAVDRFGEHGIMDLIGIIGYYDLGGAFEGERW
jgi:4-carboxymuconolactone decarboxylase